MSNIIENARRVARMRDLLKQAQDKYGYANQVTVATEELLELGAVLTKYPRYSSHEKASKALREHIIEEMADVYIVLQHLKMIFDVSLEELVEVERAKLARLERWLNSGEGMEQTTKDREW